jgi:hypothetical protein
MPDLKYGPQTEAVLALVERAGRLTFSELAALADARAAAGAAAWATAWAIAQAAMWAADRDAIWAAARIAIWDARAAVVDAVLALVMRDKLPPEHYRVLTGPWALVVGRVHPDDPEPKRTIRS